MYWSFIRSASVAAASRTWLSSGLIVCSPPLTLGSELSPSSAALRICAGLTPSWVSSERTTC